MSGTGMHTVSILMAAYNVEQYLADAAWSALHQSYTDLELIIADDGSTDRTAAVAEQIRRQDPDRVRVVTTTNGGPSVARNAGIAVARGDIFAVLDSDDIWERDFLAEQMAILAAHPEIDLVTGNGRYLGGPRHGQTVRPWPDTRPPITLERIIADEEAVFIMTVFRRRVFETIGGFDETLRGNEDFDYWLRAAVAGFRFARNAEPLAWYRRRDDSLSADAVRMLRGALRVCEKVRLLCADRPERDALDRQMAYYATELEAALARAALASGDAAAAAAALTALQQRRPSLRTGVAALLARHASPVLTALYQLKRACRV
jgi:glycosyltransferase involved in cell wall biosynthesis